MSKKCISKILSAAAKRGLTFTERDAAELLRRIQKTKALSERNMVLNLESADRLRPLTERERITEYARLTYEEMLKEKQDALRRTYLQANKNYQLIEEVNVPAKGQGIKPGPDSHINRVNEIVYRMDRISRAISEFDIADMTKAIDKYLGFFGGKITHENARNVIRELWKPDSTTDANAKELATIWSKTREAARSRMNALGANIGKLEDWIMPQTWNVARIKTAGLTNAEKAQLLNPFTERAVKDALYAKAKENWVNETLPAINRAKYFDEITGALLNDAAVRRVLSDVHDTIVQGGLNKEISPTGGRGSLAKRLGEHRGLHYKDAEAWYNASYKYGERDLFGQMMSTIHRSARDEALLTALGPNPNMGFGNALARAVHLDAGEGVYSKSAEWWSKNYFAELKGLNSIPVNSMVANFMRGLRQWLSASKLGAMLLSQFSDIGTFAAIAKTDGFGIGDSLRLMAKSLLPMSAENQAEARRQGIATSAIISDIGLRYGEATRGTTIPSKFANATIVLTGGEWWVNSMKRGAQTLMGLHTAEAAIHADPAKYDPLFGQLLKRYDIGPAEWDIIRKTQPVELMGEKIITPTAIRLTGDTPEIRNAALKYAAMLIDESDSIVATPGLRQRAHLKAGTQGGTIAGEFMRSTALFKSFTWMMTDRILPRIFRPEGMTPMSRIELAASYAVAMTILGAVSYQLKSIVKGENPYDMAGPGFWMASLAQGGGLGFFGDLALNDVNRYGGGTWATIGGPVASLMEDVGKLTAGNIRQAAQGKKTNAPAEAIDMMKGLTPVINQWYSSAAIQRAFYNRIQEAANPGYLRRMEQRQLQRNKNGMWWRPQDLTPESAPNIGAAFGGR